ncbi:fasciclin-like arabinogalactan protein 10 [Lolium rigidum]|uniref:fasciclin-like arabinogalactan protein 10 n=1 Tax=Lolium rigidum TaxID=89674 RepID=UPI001F5DF7A4|nr:fasciclin-like arabinogalactan protein 10 [Lolium rigidum]
MALRIILPLLLLAAATPASLAAIDVVQMLAGKPQYSTFLRLLRETKVAEDVSRMKTASVLVVPERAVKPLLSIPADKLRTVLLHHVLTKYFDPIQLAEMKTNVAKLQSLLSVTDKNLGTINYSMEKDGQMYLRSPGADSEAKLIKVVAARPFSISIMEISAPLVCKEILAQGRPKAKGRGGVKMMSADTEAAAGSSVQASAPAATAP